MEQKYSLHEAAYILGAHYSTIFKWVKGGKLKHTWGVNPINGAPIIMVTESQLEDCLNQHTQRAYKSINNSAKKQAKKQYLDYLDQRYDELYSEICIIEQMRKFAEEMEL